MYVTDDRIWQRAIAGARRVPPDERDFLRGLHHPNSLADLARLIGSSYPSAKVSIRSSWIDRHPQTYPRPGGFNVELGDLLVVTRTRQLGQPLIDPGVGWILQGKCVVSSPSFNTSIGSTPKEIELYEQTANWDFDLRNGSQKLGSYDIRLDGDIDPAVVSLSSSRHWHYLLFRKSTLSPGWSPPSPIQWVWPRTVALIANDSFSGGILASLTRPMPRKGVILDPKTNAEWRRLCLTLISLTKRKAPRSLPGGPWHHAHVTFYNHEIPPKQHETFKRALDDMLAPPRQSTPDLAPEDEGGGIDLIQVDVVHDGDQRPFDLR